MNKSFNTILKENQAIIFSIIKGFNLNVGDYSLSKEDLFQEGCIALYTAYTSYDECFKTKFSTYAYTIIYRRLSKIVKKLSKPLIHESLSLDCVGQKDYFEFYYSVNKDDNLGEINTLMHNIDNFKNTLKPLEQEIVDLRKQDISYDEICEKMKLNYRQVTNRIYQIRKKYQDYAKEMVL